MRVIDAKLDVALKDCLHNCDDKSGASDEYCKGIILTCGALLMAVLNYNFERAMCEIRKRVPGNHRADIWPESWR